MAREKNTITSHGLRPLGSEPRVEPEPVPLPPAPPPSDPTTVSERVPEAPTHYTVVLRKELIVNGRVYGPGKVTLPAEWASIWQGAL